MKQKILLLVFAISILTSCSSSKNNLIYFETTNNYTDTIASTSIDYSLKIVPDDELLITVTSEMPNATAAYNIPLSNPATRGNLATSTQPQQQTYIVSKEGYITFPVIGEIKVKGLSSDDLTGLITAKISESVKNPFVKVSFMNFRINVLGEVNSPGTKIINQERFSIIDAIGSAGDLTHYGKRENITLIREVNGVRTMHRINLNDAAVLKSPYFYVKQNDIIYVEPNKTRIENVKYNQNNAYKLSVISTIVSGASIVASMLITLLITNK